MARGTTALLLAAALLTGCGDGPAGELEDLPGSATPRDVPGAAGSVTEEVDQEPRPELEEDTAATGASDPGREDGQPRR